jgi:hypothetical protein
MAVVPFLGIGVVYGLLRLTVLNFQNTLNFYQQQNLYSEHILYRIYTFFHALLIYIRLMVFPVGLHMERDVAVSTSLTAGPSWLGALIILGLLGWLMYSYRFRDKIIFNIWFFGLGIFFVNLGPTSGIVPINARMYEHWLYFSLFGFFVIVAWYLERSFQYLERRRSQLKPIMVIALVAYCLFLSIQTIRRNLIWGDTEAFYQNILSYEPQNVRVLNNLGNWYSDRGNIAAAQPLYQQAVDADPTQPAPYYNLGNIARDTGDMTQAEQLYKKAIATDSSFHYAYGNLAGLYVSQHKLPEALAVLLDLEKIYPSADLKKNIQILQNAIKAR